MPCLDALYKKNNTSSIPLPASRACVCVLVMTLIFALVACLLRPDAKQKRTENSTTELNAVSFPAGFPPPLQVITDNL